MGGDGLVAEEGLRTLWLHATFAHVAAVEALLSLLSLTRLNGLADEVKVAAGAHVEVDVVKRTPRRHDALARHL